MLNPMFIAILVFVGVSALVVAVAILLRSNPASKIEDRLDVLTGTNTPAAAREGLMKQASVLTEPLDKLPGIVETFFERFGNMELLFEQADTSLTVTRLAAIAAVMGLAGVALGTTLGVHPALIPVVGLFMAAVPLMWVLFRRRRRFKAFAAQLPDALEMLSRSLRSGQSLGLGFNLISNEMSAPIAKEFGRVFDEQNLGIPLEESLDGLTDRIPNLDLKFFVTAVVLQKQTGGDLAEILDKIGALIRERFQIWGQVQALTGEGRLSGIVLLALPFVLFIAIYQLNPTYVANLFTDPIGKKMLAAAIVMQVLGALVIRKIVTIKVRQTVLLATNILTFTDFLPFALFGMVAALAWWALELAAAGKPRALERLDELKNPNARRQRETSALKKQARVTSMLERATPALAKPLTPKNEIELSKLRVKLANAGFRGESAGSIFLGLKLVGLVFGLLVASGTIAGFTGVGQRGLITGAAIVGLFFYLPTIVVGLLARSRKQAIFLALPDALDLMVVCVEAGLGLDQAMRKVAEEMKRTYRVLADEFALANFQLQMGRPRPEILHELGVRTGVSDLRALAGVLIQADKFGSSVAQALRVQSDSMRVRRRQLAEEKAAKTAVQLIFPLVLFIFPGIFVVLVGPAAITIIREMFPIMSGG